MTPKQFARFFTVALAFVLVLTLGATAQETKTMEILPAKKARALNKASFLQRFYLTGGYKGGLLPDGNVADSDTQPKSKFVGLGFSEGIGFRLPRNLSVEIEHDISPVKGTVSLISVAPDFLASLSANPEFVQIAQPLNIPTPNATLKLTMRSWPVMADYRLKLGKFQALLGGGVARTSIAHLTLAKGGIPNDLVIDDQGNVTVIMGSLRDIGTEKHWTGGVRIGVPIRLHEGMELVPRYRYFAGQHQVGLWLNFSIFGFGKDLAY